MKRKSKYFNVCVRQYQYTFGLSKRVIQTLLLMMLFVPSVFAVDVSSPQSTEIKGVITDQKTGETIVGATVLVKGTTTGVITDFDGAFSIKAGTSDILIVSFIGYTTKEVPVGANQMLKIQLEENLQDLDEVVVIGYGTIKKSHLTGAVSSLSANDLQANVAQNVATALQGKIAGVSVSSISGAPGEGMNIIIRGSGSFGSTTPLYIIDGIPGSLAMVDPSDIASLEVLKDASSAAIYGSRAANGVVLITTKGGRKNTPIKVNVNVFTGIQTAPKMWDVLDAQQWINLDFTGRVFADGVVDFEGPGTNWQEEVFQTAPITKASISFSGGTENSTYNVSAGYTNQEGILKTTGYESFNFRTKNSFSLLDDHLRIGNTVIVKMSTKKQNDEISHTDILRQNTMIPVYDENARYGIWGGTQSWMKNMDNPVGDLEANDERVTKMEFLINAYAEVDLFIKGLKYKFNIGIDRSNTHTRDFLGAHDYGATSKPLSDLRERSDWNESWVIENTLHYDNTFGKHSISGLLGYSAQENQGKWTEINALNLIPGVDVINAANSKEGSGEKSHSSLVSIFARAMYSFDDRYLLSGSVRRDGSSRFVDGHQYGIFPSVSVGWNIMNETFFESAKEVVSQLKLRASWGILGNQEIGNYLTQRTVQTGVNYVTGGTWWKGAITGLEWKSPLDLTWEETETFNIGVDASFLNGKLSITADYFQKTTNDVLMDVEMPISAGLTGSSKMNSATITNKGFEMAITHRNTIGDVYYNIGANLSTVKNEVEDIHIGSKQRIAGTDVGGEGYVTWHQVGEALGTFYLVETDGIFQTREEVANHKNKDGSLIQPLAKPGDIRFVDFDGDGVITTSDAQNAGSPFPDFTYGIRAGMQWKGVDLNLFFDGVVGNSIYNYPRVRAEAADETTNYSAAVLNAWTESNRSTTQPRLVFPDANKNGLRVSDRWLEDGSFFRLKTLELGYTLPSEWTNRVKMDKLRIYTAMDNLFTITDYTGYTPDIGAEDSSSPHTRGVDIGRYPHPLTITFGLQLDF